MRTSGHRLDWSNQPIPYKIYLDLDRIPLFPNERELPPAFTSPPPATTGAPTLEQLSRLLYLSAGITKKIVYGDGRELFFRAAANTGALYEIDLYVVSGAVAGLEDGVYHFSPHDFSLRRLRRGDHRDAVATACGGEPHAIRAGAFIVCSGTYWRNAWKYQARTYRHFGWDNGTMLGNLLAVAAAEALRATVVGGFVDDSVNQLLGLNPLEEVAFSIVALGEDAVHSPAPALEPLQARTRPLSAHPRDYPQMRDMHDASSLSDAESVCRWREQVQKVQVTVPSGGEAVDLPPAASSDVPLDKVIVRRGSSRRFQREPISAPQLAALLEATSRPLAGDMHPAERLWNQVFVIVNAVDGVASGAYYYSDGRLHLIRAGEFRDMAGYLDLEQDLAADAAVNLYYLADMDAILAGAGNRGYRMMQLEAGIMGGRAYLAAYALGLGATGLTFYDDDVVSFFAPASAGLKTIFLVAVGRPARRQRS